MTEFKKGDRVLFADNEHNRDDCRAMIGKTAVVLDPHWFTQFGGPYVQVQEDETGRVGGWYPECFELLGREDSVRITGILPDCPNCGKTAAPEHVANGKARCWWCESKWTLPGHEGAWAPAARLSEPATLVCHKPGYTARIKNLPEPGLKSGAAIAMVHAVRARAARPAFTEEQSREIDRLLSSIKANMALLSTPLIFVDAGLARRQLALPDLEEPCCYGMCVAGNQHSDDCEEDE